MTFPRLSSTEGAPGGTREGTRDRGSALPQPLRRSLAGLVLVVIAVRVLAPVKDPDAFWHIAAGRHLNQSWDFVLSDPFGAAAEKRWILNQWAPELLMSWADRVAGLPGIAWLVSLACAVLVFTVWVACRRRASALVAAAVTALTVLAMSASLSPRPQLITFVLTVVTVDAWLRTTVDTRPRWWLVPLSWVWACSHGMWFIGPAAGAVVVLGMVVEARLSRAQVARLALIPVLSVAVAAVTPVGPVLLLSPFQVGQVTGLITEWQPARATEPAFAAACAMLVIVLLWLARDSERRRWPVILLFAMAGVLAFMSLRTVAVAAAVLAPITAQALQALSGLSREPLVRRETVSAFVLGGTGLALAALLAPTVAGQAALGRSELDAPIKALPAGTVLCNDQIDGGWLIWKHPNVRVTIDTRVEIYSVDHINQYLDFMAARPGWERYPTRVGCSHALLDRNAPVVEALESRLNWSVLAESHDSVLLEAPRS